MTDRVADDEAVKPFRIIPVLLLERRRLVKTTRYRNPRYVGDPINAVRIFDDKQVDELAVLDIRAQNAGIDFPYLRKVVSEAFMPVAYGGGVRSLNDIRDLLRVGVEKVVLGSAAVETPELVSQAAARFGSQSIVVSVDVRSDWRGRRRLVHRNALRCVGGDPLGFAQSMVRAGAGEILLNDVDREGTMSGLDLEFIRPFTASLGVPVIASGGAASARDLVAAWRRAGAHAVAAGSLFVFKGPLRAVLINYPSDEVVRAAVALEAEA